MLFPCCGARCCLLAAGRGAVSVLLHHVLFAVHACSSLHAPAGSSAAQYRRHHSRCDNDSPRLSHCRCCSCCRGCCCCWCCRLWCCCACTSRPHTQSSSPWHAACVVLHWQSSWRRWAGNECALPRGLSDAHAHMVPGAHTYTYTLPRPSLSCSFSVPPPLLLPSLPDLVQVEWCHGAVRRIDKAYMVAAAVLGCGTSLAALLTPHGQALLGFDCLGASEELLGRLSATAAAHTARLQLREPTPQPGIIAVPLAVAAGALSAYLASLLLLLHHYCCCPGSFYSTGQQAEGATWSC